MPVLVGPEARIRAVAAAAEIDISRLRAIAARAQPCRRRAGGGAGPRRPGGRADEGALHTDELMHAVVGPRDWARHRPPHEPRLRDGRADLSAAAVHHRRRPQHRPDLEAKRDIVQNAIDLALAWGSRRREVAILSAVETVRPQVRSTLDAAALAKMAERGQIIGGLVDGPLAFDNAVSPRGRPREGHRLGVAGQADIVVVPDSRAATCSPSSSTTFGRRRAAGLLSGGACRSPSPAAPTARWTRRLVRARGADHPHAGPAQAEASGAGAEAVARPPDALRPATRESSDAENLI